MPSSISIDLHMNETFTNMASKVLSAGMEKAQVTLGGEKGAKIRDLERDTKNVHDPNNRITSDWGVKQTNTDDWLKVVNEDDIGPHLLEDAFGREKVTSSNSICYPGCSLTVV